MKSRIIPVPVSPEDARKYFATLSLVVNLYEKRVPLEEWIETLA